MTIENDKKLIEQLIVSGIVNSNAEKTATQIRKEKSNVKGFGNGK